MARREARVSALHPAGAAGRFYKDEAQGTKLVSLREIIKRALPDPLRQAAIRAREWAAAPPLEDIALHEYAFVADPAGGRRLNLVIPHVEPGMAFGGIATGIELLLGIGGRTGAELRILLDEFGPLQDRSVVEKAARAAGIDPGAIEIVPRTEWVPRVGVRRGDVFMGFHSWIVLNLVPLLREQQRRFGGAAMPLLYPIQEYEPLFYPMSSTHMMARAAFDLDWPCWGIFNSHELHGYFLAQGHRVAREFVFEPQLSAALRPFLASGAPEKARIVLVYGRASIPRNCFPALVKGLRRWAERYPQYAGWEVVSAGLPHRPVPFASGRAMRSRGKLPLPAYAALLRESAVGVSLMASPHPSYPPLEMAHFGVRTITNGFTGKDLSASHPNIVSVRDIGGDTLADALAECCAAFEAAPGAAWGQASLRPSFLETAPYPCLDAIAGALRAEVWAD